MAKIIDIKLTRIVYNLTVDFLDINLSSKLLLGELNRTSKGIRFADFKYLRI